MINEQPIDQTGEIVRFGNPWHGQVIDGILTLPPGGSIATKTWPQPARASVRNFTGVTCDSSGTTAVGVVIQDAILEPDIAGFTHALAPPDAPALLPDPPADAAHQWRREALLSGAQQQLYGKDLNGWIWCASPGVRKRVTLDIPAGPVSLESPLTITGTRDNFGFGVAAEPETLAATLPDWRQYGGDNPLLSDGIDNPVYTNFSGNCQVNNVAAADVANPTYKQGRLTLYAVSPTGDRALIEVSAATLAETTHFTDPIDSHGFAVLDPFICRHPIGWLLVTMTPAGMDIAAILSRAQTIGATITTDSNGAKTYEFTGYRLMGFFHPATGEINWFSWSGKSSSITGVDQYTRVTRLLADLTPTADVIEITGDAAGNNVAGADAPYSADGLVSRAYVSISFNVGSVYTQIRAFRIGNGAVGFIDTSNNGSGGLEPGKPYTNYPQILTPIGVVSVPAQTAIWPPHPSNSRYLDLYNGPHFSSYNHATGEISALWQSTPVCWV